MKTKVVKYIGGILAFIFVAPLIYTILYFLVEIRPHTVSMAEKIEIYNNISPNLTLMEKIAVSEEGRSGMVRYVSHSLAVENTKSGFRNFWHLIGLHWHLWVRVMYSEQEQYFLWLALAPYGKGRGMNEAAVYHFNKPFEQLSCYQLTQLVVMVRAPTRFKPGSEKSEQRIKDRGVANVCSS
jgi:hypothetical protein